MPAVDDVERELRRIVDRLDSMPLHRAASAGPACREAAEYLVQRTRELTDAIPADAVLPDLAPQGLGSMLAVVGRDLVDAAVRRPQADLTEVAERLTALRRALP